MVGTRMGDRATGQLLVLDRRIPTTRQVTLPLIILVGRKRLPYRSRSHRIHGGIVAAGTFVGAAPKIEG